VRAGIRLSWLLLAISGISTALCAACARPTGPIHESNANYDNLWTVPRRQVYKIGDDFVRSDDMWVFASVQGSVESIDVNKVTISLITNPDAAEPDEPIVIANGEYTLAVHVGKGRKLVTVTYNKMIAEYSIHIEDPNELVPVDPNETDDAPAIIIIWG